MLKWISRLNVFFPLVIKKALLRLKFNSSDDLLNDTMRDRILQKVCICRNTCTVVSLLYTYTLLLYSTCRPSVVLQRGLAGYCYLDYLSTHFCFCFTWYRHCYCHWCVETLFNTQIIYFCMVHIVNEALQSKWQ